ncbi:MAG: DUF3995 domain-containing protein [Actinomycetota bacterium]|nr:DUF3995 domain-containing protein [Actinomycetota bacterium]
MAKRAAPTPTGLRFAQAALVVGLLYAVLSLYWGLGGTWLVDTIARSVRKEGLALAAAVLKLIAAVLPLLALRRLSSPAWNRKLWLLTWIEAAILTIYGLVQTVGDLLAEAGVVHVSASAAHGKLAFYAYLWDPWFLIWGLLVGGALLQGRRSHSQTAGWA